MMAPVIILLGDIGAGHQEFAYTSAKLYSHPLSPFAHTFLGIAAHLGRDYAKATEVLETALELDPRFGEARRMLDFCALPWEGAVLEFHRQTQPATTASAATTRRTSPTPARSRACSRPASMRASRSCRWVG